MKKRNKILILLLVLFVVALLSVSLVACNDNLNPDDNGKPNNYEPAKYTVTFNTNGGTVLANSVIRDVVYGTRISAPLGADGTPFKPYKRGYEFFCWSKDGSNPYDWTLGITENTTLTAIYNPNKYEHDVVLTAKLEYDEATQKFSVNENARDINDVGLGAGNTIVSTFNSNGDKFACPTAEDPEIGKFCFWYYIDDEGNPVQLTKFKADNESTVDPLEKYNFTHKLTVYPMFTDNLPKVTVKYADTLSAGIFKTEEYTFGQNIPISQSRPYPTANGYTFDYWYYVVKDKDADGNETSENYKFIFEDEGEQNPTSPMDAAKAKNNFAPAELILYAKWTREIKIDSVADFRNLYNEIRSLTVDDPTDEQKEQLENILNANIFFTSDINFDSEETTLRNQGFEPLFDREHPFKGTIDGATYGENSTVLKTAKLSGGIFGSATSASIFGYNQGTIKNIVFENIGLRIKDSTENLVYVGTVTTENGGTIDTCSVVYTNGLDISYDRGIMFGGVTARNIGTSANSSALRFCSVRIIGFTSNCEALTFGGVAGESNASASITRAIVDIDVYAITCKDDGLASNGRSSLTMGGIVGNNSSVIRLSDVNNFNVERVESLTEFVFGGAAGINTREIRTTMSNVTLGSANDPAKVRGSLTQTVAVGGLAGINRGMIYNSYTVSELFVAVENAPKTRSDLFIGGLVGSNYSEEVDSNTASESGVCAINKSYSRGSIAVTVADGIENVTVYAGGITGRNSHKKMGALFSTMNISVSNAGENNVGRIAGKMLETATNGNIFYMNEAVLEYGGEADNNTVCTVGNVATVSDFKSKVWVLGEGGNSTLNFNGTIWEIVGDNYPTFKSDNYNNI